MLPTTIINCRRCGKALTNATERLNNCHHACNAEYLLFKYGIENTSVIKAQEKALRSNIAHIKQRADEFYPVSYAGHHAKKQQRLEQLTERSEVSFLIKSRDSLITQFLLELLQICFIYINSLFKVSTQSGPGVQDMVPQHSLGIAIIDNIVAASAAYDEQKAVSKENKELIRKQKELAVFEENKERIREKKELSKKTKEHLIREHYLELIIAQINLQALSVLPLFVYFHY